MQYSSVQSDQVHVKGVTTDCEEGTELHFKTYFIFNLYKHYNTYKLIQVEFHNFSINSLYHIALLYYKKKKKTTFSMLDKKNQQTF